MLRLSLSAGVVFLAACGNNTDATQAGAGNEKHAAALSGWIIDPPGDLNGFFDCLAAEGLALVSAHRGGPSAGYPENAVETMAMVLADIPALMEIDVATSADGVLYLMHDDTLERTTTGQGATDGLDWAAIKALKLEDNEGNSTPYAPSRFADALQWAKGRTILQIDFKRTTRYGDVAAEINRQGAEDRVILIAYSMAAARKLHRLVPNAMISLSVNSQSELNAAVAAGIPANRLMGFTGTQDPRPRLFSTLNSRNVEVIFGTLGGRSSIDNDIARTGAEALYAEIAAQGADLIATDRPRQAHAALAAAGRGVTAEICGISKL